MITVTVTGNLADDPHTFRTSDGRAGCDLRLAIDLPPRGATGESQVRYVKAVAFGVLATHAAESVRKGDRVTIQGHDLTAEAWGSAALRLVSGWRAVGWLTDSRFAILTRVSWTVYLLPQAEAELRLLPLV
jgi:hypothetical protein